MGQESLRLGGLLAVFEPDVGLVFRDVHSPKFELTVNNSDLAELFEFVRSHVQTSKEVPEDTRCREERPIF